MKDLATRIADGSMPVPEAGCWIWLRATDANGYGRLMADGEQLLAHRAAYTAFVGEIPGGLCVCHRCDTPGCVNPAHLFVGSHVDNARDRHAKGRSSHVGCPKGAQHPRAKLAPRQIEEIRARYALGRISQRELGARLGVHHSTVGAIVRGEHWNDGVRG